MKHVDARINIAYSKINLGKFKVNRDSYESPFVPKSKHIFGNLVYYMLTSENNKLTPLCHTAARAVSLWRLFQCCHAYTRIIQKNGESHWSCMVANERSGNQFCQPNWHDLAGKIDRSAPIVNFTKIIIGI